MTHTPFKKEFLGKPKYNRGDKTMTLEEIETSDIYSDSKR